MRSPAAILAQVTNHRLLLVEDDERLREVFARGLREEGFVVVTASDGTGAIRTAARQQFEAVLMVIGLPDSDGRDVCQALRARGLDAPVIFLSARAVSSVTGSPAFRRAATTISANRSHSQS